MNKNNQLLSIAAKITAAIISSNTEIPITDQDMTPDINGIFFKIKDEYTTVSNYGEQRYSLITTKEQRIARYAINQATELLNLIPNSNPIKTANQLIKQLASEINKEDFHQEYIQEKIKHMKDDIINILSIYLNNQS